MILPSFQGLITQMDLILKRLEMPLVKSLAEDTNSQEEKDLDVGSILNTSQTIRIHLFKYPQNIRYLPWGMKPWGIAVTIV